MRVQVAAPHKNKPSMEEYVKKCDKAMQTGKKTDMPKVLQSQLQEVQRGMENRALANLRSQPKVEEPKSTPNSPNANTSTTTTMTLAKTSLYKEKDMKAEQ